MLNVHPDEASCTEILSPAAADEFFEFPASYGQQRLWLIDQLEPGSAIYNVPCVVRMKGELRIPVLQECLNEIVRRHEVLRTVFVNIDGKVLQRIRPHGLLPLDLTDLTNVSSGEQQHAAANCAIQEARKPFDLTEGPVVRARLIRVSADEHLLVLTFHHIVSDGWSVGVLVSELTALYAAYSAGTPSPLEELPLQYADYAVWQREALDGDILAEQVGYWREQLAGLQVLNLPTDKPRPAVRRRQGADIRWSLNKDLARRLTLFCQREKVTVFMALLAAFEVLLARHSGQTDIAVGAPIAGRNRLELEGLIGFFVNTLVLRADFSGEPSFRKFWSKSFILNGVWIIRRYFR
jgi:hypothetical protein